MHATVRRYGGRQLAERAAERRQRFVDAAMHIFAEQGYVSASVADICASAGLSKRQFYEEFATREDALIAAYDRIQTEIAATLRAVIDSTPSAAQGTDVASDQRSLVRSVLRPLLGFVSEDPYRAKIIFVVVVGVSERMERRRRDTRHALAEMFEAAIRLAGPRARARGGSQLAISTLIGALNGLANEWLLTEPRISVEELTDLLIPVVEALIDNPEESTHEQGIEPSDGGGGKRDAKTAFNPVPQHGAVES